ncbi:hypothetical protein [Ferruginibacter albus]|uniref:hypothetical protein n=1 Tax=Ferruginibacter albus TaxID=2875540 RepID=UPI001CC4F7DA|nr:hypothetical protein [Ferruginibacter albus]UAY53514.1 hypothetical protein K9M53_07530 [Ferruginibacter albus]
MNATVLNNAIRKYGISFLFGCWLLITVLHLYLYGIGTTLEAEKYIGEANRLINRQGFTEVRYVFYSLTIFIIWLSLTIKIGLSGAVVIQALYNLFALFFFFKSLRQIFNSEVYPFAITLLLIVFSPYSSWTVYLYTESVFYSSCLLLLAALINYIFSKNAKTFFFLLISMLLVILARPLGILFLAPVWLFLFVDVKRKTKFILIPIAIAGCVLFVYISNIVFSTTNDANSTLAAQTDCIICGIRSPSPHAIKITSDGSQVYQLYYYIINNFEHFLQLGTIRLKYFFLMTRSYYSNLHNLFLLAFMIPLYFFTIISWFILKGRTYRPIYIFQLSSIFIFAVAVMLQCDDFHNRFILALFPFFLTITAKTIEHVLERKKS